MATSVTMAAIERAQNAHDRGDYTRVWQILGEAGDTYAASAAEVLDDIPDFFGDTVRNARRQQQPGSISITH